LQGHPFPVTFSISAPGRIGDLAIDIQALEPGGLLVGKGSGAAPLTADTADVLLDAVDFVVNTDYADDQFPSDDPEAGGFQVTALPDGTWPTVFRDACRSPVAGSCNVFARRFDKTALPVQTQAAAGINAFVATGRPTTGATTPAIAAGQSTTALVWNFH